MKPTRDKQAIYYPFHLCHPTTLEQLLIQFDAVHFRDYMALQITPLSGTTAYEDRMGDTYPSLVTEGRIVQGYRVSGPLDPDITSLVNRDLMDGAWRQLFHEAFVADRRFQRGLFDPSHGMHVGSTLVPGPAALLRLMEQRNSHHPYSVDRVKELTRHLNTLDHGYDFEYGLALLKTSAALAYSIRLSLQHGLQAVTDSASHYELLSHTLDREGILLTNNLIPRNGY